MAVLGASARQRGAFIWTESRWIVAGGVIGGLVAGTVVAYQLVKVLNGIFDPARLPAASPEAKGAATRGAVMSSTSAVGGAWIDAAAGWSVRTSRV